MSQLHMDMLMQFLQQDNHHNRRRAYTAANKIKEINLKKVCIYLELMYTEIKLRDWPEANWR